MNWIKGPDGRLLHENKRALACVGAGVSICSFSPSLQVWLTGQTSLTMPWWDPAGLRSKWRLVRVLLFFSFKDITCYLPFTNGAAFKIYTVQFTNESWFMIRSIVSNGKIKDSSARAEDRLFQFWTGLGMHFFFLMHLLCPLRLLKNVTEGDIQLVADTVEIAEKASNS